MSKPKFKRHIVVINMTTGEAKVYKGEYPGDEIIAMQENGDEVFVINTQSRSVKKWVGYPDILKDIVTL